MKVLKFGGTSVGTPESLLSVRNIVESASKGGPVIVVVSALGGITDKLLLTARLAQQSDAQWKEEFSLITDRHHTMIERMVPGNRQRDVFELVDSLLNELRSIYFGVSLIRDLSDKTLNTIVSYGERLSSLIVSNVINGARLYDSRQFIKTVEKHQRTVLHKSLTEQMVKDAFADFVNPNSQLSTLSSQLNVALVPGFISSDRDTGDITNLGRGGSDYTASIIAAALDAEILEIWTDVDGFMTADPRVIPTAYTIKELSYIEAMELCNFGAKVIYPPTIYPVCIKNIPIRVKNTFNPENPGSIIRAKVENDKKPIKGISSIKGTSLVNVSGLSMVGVIGVNQRIFTALTNHHISVFMVSQASSENSTSIGVRDEDAQAAADVLNEEFRKEIHTGAMFPMTIESGLATIAIVGENMKHLPGIAGKLFGTLGRSGISVIACAQGASETNISFVVEGKYLRKSLNVLHDSFFLSEYKVLNIFVCGIGTVGGKLLDQIHKQYAELRDRKRLKLNVVGIASSRKAIYCREGINLADYRKLMADAPESNCQLLLQNILEMNIYNSVFVDCTASPDVAAMYQDLLSNNINVVAANKVAASSEYSNYQALKRTALERGVKYLFETNVGAGLPIISTINDLRNSGDEILGIEAVLSGTLNYIFNTLSNDVPFSKAVRMSVEAGYAEPDPRIDLSGTDVIRKLVILSREAGYQVEQSDVEAHLFMPDEYFQGTADDFWRKLPELDHQFEKYRQKLEAEGKRLRFVAKLDEGKTSVSLREVSSDHPFYSLEGSNNIIQLKTSRYNEFPMLIKGYGAGASVTAAGVFANIMSIANI